jgi:hypothetical protein
MKPARAQFHPRPHSSHFNLHNFRHPSAGEKVSKKVGQQWSSPPEDESLGRPLPTTRTRYWQNRTPVDQLSTSIRSISLQPQPRPLPLPLTRMVRCVHVR